MIGQPSDETRNTKSRLFVKNRRKDGKYTVVYVYPCSGRKLTKIITAETLQTERDSDKYDIRASY